MKTTSQKISGLSRILLAMSALALVASLFLPIWRIELDAPQYPEGLVLKINANKIAGNVDIINGLNHYIGMKTLHTEDFIEFTLLPYLIGFFAAFSLITSFIGRKKVLVVLFSAFVAFGIVAMVDFWRWEYNYGHNLDPNAAIIVPGMAYQPPLIGFKQLLNFGAFSVPDVGGWLFIGSGLLMLSSLLMETKIFMKKSVSVATAAITLMFLFVSCKEAGPEPAKLNIDNCAYCQMTISDAKFVSELITEKGRVYKFDDLACMKNYLKENNVIGNFKVYVADFDKTSDLVNAKEAFYAIGETIGSPMGGNAAAFSTRESAEIFSKTKDVQIQSWNDIKFQ